MEDRYGIPAAQAIARVGELLESRDVWTELQQRKLLLYSAYKLKEQIEVATVDVEDSSQINSFLAVLRTIGEMLDKQSGITDRELEVVTEAQSKAMLRLIDAAFGRARSILQDMYPTALEDVDSAFASGLQEAVLGIETT